MSTLISHFREMSGRALAGSAFLIDRYRDDLPWSAKDTETWVGVVDAAGQARLIRGEVAWYTDVWSSSSGRIYLTFDHALIIGAPPTVAGGSYSWSTLALPLRAWGVWGLSDELFYAWGFDGKQQLVARVERGAVSLLSVPGPVVSMSGTSPDLLYVAGEDGLLARLEGHAFVQVSVQERASFNRVQVISDQEIYASTRSGAVWEGSVHGFSPLPAGPSGMMGVTTFGASLFAATESSGVQQLSQAKWTKLETPKPARKAWGDQSLFMLGDKHLIETHNLTDFTVIELASLAPTYDAIRFDRTQRIWLG